MRQYALSTIFTSGMPKTPFASTALATPCPRTMTRVAPKMACALLKRAHLVTRTGIMQPTFGVRIRIVLLHPSITAVARRTSVTPTHAQTNLFTSQTYKMNRAKALYVMIQTLTHVVCIGLGATHMSATHTMSTEVMLQRYSVSTKRVELMTETPVASQRPLVLTRIVLTVICTSLMLTKSCAETSGA